MVENPSPVSGHSPPPNAGMPEGEELNRQLAGRNRSARIWLAIFQLALIFAIVALVALLYKIVNDSFGLVAIENTVDPQQILLDVQKQRLLTAPDTTSRDDAATAEGVAAVPNANDILGIADLTAAEIVPILEQSLPHGVYRRLQREMPLAKRTHQELLDLLNERVIDPTVVASWGATESIFERAAIEAQVKAQYPDASLAWRRWLNLPFLTQPQSSVPEQAGIRTAILGSLWVVMITILFAVPVGIGAAIYLEEYAGKSRLQQIIQTNIDNLAGVPSIIYGILGLTVFVRALEPITSGSAFGFSDPTTANGRTVIAAGLTLSLLVLPVVIINAQEAIRAVPRSLREAGYGLGATKWQVVRSHVLTNALPGIFTGTILAISRALGETAPVIVVGASTFIMQDPTSPFSKFTVLPMQIYQWTSRPQPEFKHIAAAASLVLLIMLLLINGTAIVLRNRYAKTL